MRPCDDTHVHLVAERTDRPLAHFMQRLLTGHAVAFNRRHARAGHLFQNRYRSVLCERDPYLLALVRYIHRNPVRAGIVPAPERCPWSCHRTYLGQATFDGLDCGTVLALFGPRLTEARRRFREFVDLEAAAPDGAEHTVARSEWLPSPAIAR